MDKREERRPDRWMRKDKTYHITSFSDIVHEPYLHHISTDTFLLLSHCTARNIVLDTTNQQTDTFTNVCVVEGVEGTDRLAQSCGGGRSRGGRGRGRGRGRDRQRHMGISGDA
jgi:hypothetical protein